jgi:hypothetical protein
MGNISSIHICPLKPSAMLHNERRKQMGHVREDLKHLNETWINPAYKGKSLGEIRKDIGQRYFEHVHQRMQSKAEPLREGVVNIRENTTLDELQSLADRLQHEFGIKTVSIYTHRDEGHEEDGLWIPNHHAHLIFDWTTDQGKCINLKRQDLARMQTVVAETLDMERGKSSDVKHLDAIQYKNKMQEEQNRQLRQETKYLQDQLDELSVKNRKLSEELERMRMERTELGNMLETLKMEIESLNISKPGKQRLKEAFDVVSSFVGKSDVRLKYEANLKELQLARVEMEKLQQTVEKIKTDLKHRSKERDKAKEETHQIRRERDTYAIELERQRERAEKAERKVRMLDREFRPWKYSLPDVVDLSRCRVDYHGGRNWLHVTIEGHDRYLTRSITEAEAAMFRRDEITLPELIGRYFTDEIDRACYRRWQHMEGKTLENELHKVANTMFYQLPRILFPQRMFTVPGGSRDGENLNLRHKSRDEILREMVDEGYEIKIS